MLHLYELSANIIINPKVNQILHYLIDLGWVQATVQEWGNACWSCSVNPIEIHKKGKPGDQVLIETWKDMKPSKQLQPRLKVPYTIILAPSMAIKVLSITSWSISLGKKTLPQDPKDIQSSHTASQNSSYALWTSWRPLLTVLAL